MGSRDSTKTRVEPIFSRLKKPNSSMSIWLPALLSLPGGWLPKHPRDSELYKVRDILFGDKEKALAAPLSLLSWLIRNPRSPTSGSLSSDVEKAAIRKEWIEGSQARIAEGLSQLRLTKVGKPWHIFEGDTKPDVFIETDALLVVIEGKRTEAGITTSTKWMECRHQMLRHLDGAWETRGQRDVVGFLAVEGDEKGGVPLHWCKQARLTTNFEVVKKSLPHRSIEEQWEIARSFIGVTTWQAICKALEIPFEQLPDEVVSPDL